MANVLKTIWRMIDLTIAISDRAQKACLAASVTGVRSSAMYDGGLEVKAAHLLPEFQKGKPPFRKPTEVVVGRIDDYAPCVLKSRRVRYIPETDAWQWECGSTHKRLDADLWITATDFPEAFDRAIHRVKRKLH